MATPGGIADLSGRELEILRAIVSDFIATGEPVGSGVVAPRCDVSPATVRGVMADLEELGLLEKPHTSAGRVPTDKGYRLYVDGLLRVRQPGPRERERIEKGLQPAALSDLLAGTSKLLHELTHHASVVVAPRFDQTVFHRLELVKLREDRVLAIFVSPSGLVQNRLITAPFPVTADELGEATNYLSELLAGGLTLAAVQARLRQEMEGERATYDALARRALALGEKAVEASPAAPPQVVIEGEESFLDQPEFASDVERMKTLFAELARKERLIAVLESAIAGRDIRIFIGAESEFSAASGVSLVVAPYAQGGEVLGALAVVGPMRMNYGRVIPLVDYTARAVSRALDDV
jgi:heat-inducible transcriptional repressor